MSTCTDSPTAARIGCGQTYSGELQHCVARTSWSTHPDGRAHITAARSTIDELWRKGGNEPADPAQLGFEQDDRGRWRSPGADGGFHWTADSPETAQRHTAHNHQGETQ